MSLKMYRFVVLVCSVLCLTSAYDWSDSDFNLILQQDLQDHYNIIEDEYMPVNYRVTRDVASLAEPTKAPPTSTSSAPATDVGCKTTNITSQSTPSSNTNRYQRVCCGGDKDELKMHGEALKELRRECFQMVKKARGGRSEGPLNMFSCEKVGRTKDDLVCVMECVGRKKQLVDKDGNLLPEDVTKFVKTDLVTQDWQKEIIDDVIAKCLKEVNTPANSTVGSSGRADESSTTTTASPTMPPTPSPPKCNMSSLKFSHCIWREMQLSCPKNLIKDTRSCQRMRERLLRTPYPKVKTVVKSNKGSLVKINSKN